ncbi:MAG TPA: hypothetical protein VMO47_05665 [Rhodothermales bacterium]|nr:hypothetical protein [Rhodothermales bacterium]
MANFLLNKGGAGKSITRHETAGKMSELVRRLISITRTYERLLAALGNAGSDHRVGAMQNRTRTDIGKLSEIILSTGGITPRYADPVSTSDDPDQLIRALNEAERAFRDELEESLKLKHHYRTIAVLETLHKNTEDRIRLVRELAHDYNVPVG